MNNQYRDKVLFLTGVTGFIGSVLLETILNKIPEVKHVYCLYRKNKTTDDPRVVWVQGDITLPDWGISENALNEIKENVNYIFHLAAYTSWNITLKEQVDFNTMPVLYGAEIASGIKNLDAYVITSSYWAACHLSDKENIEEKIFQDFQAEKELKAIQNDNSPARINEWPNAYSYSKNLAERLVHQRYSNLPIVIARVTSACGAWQFPQHGFCQYHNALPALLIPIVKRGIRCFPDSVKTAVNDSIPVDICVNILLANALNCPVGIKVIHCSAANRNLPKLGEIFGMVSEIKYFSDEESLYAELSRKENKSVSRLNKLLLKTYDFAFKTHYVFSDEHARLPLQWMTTEEKEKFPIDVDIVDWKKLIPVMMRDAI